MGTEDSPCGHQGSSTAWLDPRLKSQGPPSPGLVSPRPLKHPSFPLLPFWTTGSRKSLWEAGDTELFKSGRYKAVPLRGTQGRTSASHEAWQRLQSRQIPATPSACFRPSISKLQASATLEGGLGFIPPHREPPPPLKIPTRIFSECDPPEASQKGSGLRTSPYLRPPDSKPGFIGERVFLAQHCAECFPRVNYVSTNSLMA